jgi:aminoglycoside 3-N-acetyltransferase
MSLHEIASDLAARYLNHEQRLALRAAYHAVRSRLNPLLRAAYGTFDAAALREHLDSRLGRNFEVLMVHSSLNHMQPTYTGSAVEVVRNLIEWCGPERTLAMPTFCFGDPATGGTHAVLKREGRFDVRRTPSDMGMISELFRRWKGVVHSRHPYYRVSALGPHAAALTEGHERAATPAGAGTPFDFMAKHDTLIIGLGKPFEVLTQIHHAEDLMGDSFPVPSEPGEQVAVMLVDGKVEVPFEVRGRNLLWRLNIWNLRKLMTRETLQEWRFHNVPLFATRAADVTGTLLRAAERGETLYVKPQS